MLKSPLTLAKTILANVSVDRFQDRDIDTVHSVDFKELVSECRNFIRLPFLNCIHFNRHN